ncbi:MAG: ribosome silencing factor [Zoogloeaceae bacterium]|jgi:ribosome-associated protein|nr:ribosome silencing factor [Zoogloeaceae bacterium]
MIKTVTTALEDVKGKDIVVLDTRALSSLFDAMIIATGDSARQVKALADRVCERAKERHDVEPRIEGHPGAQWVLVDLGNVIVQAMTPAARDYYRLEELWTAA